MRELPVEFPEKVETYVNVKVMRQLGLVKEIQELRRKIAEQQKQIEQLQKSVAEQETLLDTTVKALSAGGVTATNVNAKQATPAWMCIQPAATS